MTCGRVVGPASADETDIEKGLIWSACQYQTV